MKRESEQRCSNAVTRGRIGASKVGARPPCTQPEKFRCKPDIYMAQRYLPLDMTNLTVEIAFDYVATKEVPGCGKGGRR